MPEGGERSQMTHEEFLKAIGDDIDPMKHAGESWFSTEEYARPGDIHSPYTRGEVGHEGAYYPGPDRKRKNMRGY